MREPKPPKPPTVEDIAAGVTNDLIRLIESTGVLTSLLDAQTHRSLFRDAAREYLKVHADRILDQLFGLEAA